MMSHAKNDKPTSVVQVGECADGLVTLTHENKYFYTSQLHYITNSEDRLRIHSQRQKRCGTSKKKTGIVKSEHVKGLILERMMIIIIIMITIMLRFSGYFLRGTRHVRLEVLTVLIQKVRAVWNCNIWVLLTQGTTHTTTRREFHIQSRYPYCIYDQVVYMLHCLSHRSSTFPKLSYIMNQNVTLSPKSTSTTLPTNVHSPQNTPHTLHN